MFIIKKFPVTKVRIYQLITAKSWWLQVLLAFCFQGPVSWRSHWESKHSRMGNIIPRFHPKTGVNQIIIRTQEGR
jgi:hypothetical protein